MVNHPNRSKRNKDYEILRDGNVVAWRYSRWDADMKADEERRNHPAATIAVRAV